MHWKRFGLYLLLLFVVSFGSSAATWVTLTRHQHKETSWKKTLKLTPDQEKKFSAMESQFNQVLKQLAIEHAQNKISICSQICTENMDSKEIDHSSQKMAALYEQKQKALATTLASISSMLTPEQKKIFSTTLRKEICESCRRSAETNQCLCGMCTL